MTADSCKHIIQQLHSNTSASPTLYFSDRNACQETTTVSNYTASLNCHTLDRLSLYWELHQNLQLTKCSSLEEQNT